MCTVFTKYLSIYSLSTYNTPFFPPGREKNICRCQLGKLYKKGNKNWDNFLKKQKERRKKKGKWKSISHINAKIKKITERVREGQI